MIESSYLSSSNSSLKPTSVTVGGVLCGGPLMISSFVCARFRGLFRDETTLDASHLIANALPTILAD